MRSLRQGKRSHGQKQARAKVLGVIFVQLILKLRQDIVEVNFAVFNQSECQYTPLFV